MITLLESDIDFSQLVESSLESKMISSDGKVLYVNQACLRLLSARSKSDIIGKSIFDILHPDFHNDTKVRSNNICSQLAVAPLTERKMIRLDGKVIDTEVLSSPYIYKGRTLIQSTIRDITDRKNSEKLMIQSEKLSAIGKFASGIVHDIRNPLTTIKGFLQLIKTELPHSFYPDIVLKEINQIESIANELLYLAKPRESLFVSIDLINILKETIRFVDSEAFKRNITVNLEIEEKIENIFILGDATQLKQVFLNLIKNSIEAMENGGKIVVEVRLSSQNVYISIKDNGIGIPKDALHKIGQSFYTNKSQGTGLGLMVTHNIIKNHNGTIHVESEENIGTTFIVSLPLDD